MNGRPRNPLFWLPEKVGIAGMVRLAVVYLVLVLYGFTYEHFYSTQLTPLFHTRYISYDMIRSSVYTLVNFLTPLAVLPIGTRLRAPGQILAGAFAVFLFIPIPIVFTSMVTPPQFWRIYAILWVSCFMICTLSSLSVDIRRPVVTDAGFRRMLFFLYGFIALAFLYVVATNHVAFVGFDKAHAARDEVTVSGVQGYVLNGYMASFGGLLIIMAVKLRKYYLIVPAIAGFIVCYGTLAERNALLMPAWILYILIAHKLFFRESVPRYLLTVMAPFLIGTLIAEIIGTDDREALLYDAFTLANFRLYSVPGLAFNVYYDFFQTHPLTYWSHINIVSSFVRYPYGEPLSLVMADQYQMGNYNASFIETDGVAAAGLLAVPFISILMGFVLVAVNSCFRGLHPAIFAVAMAGPSITLIDTGLGPGLLTNGLAALAVFVFFAPRTAPWNSWRRRESCQ